MVVSLVVAYVIPLLQWSPKDFWDSKKFKNEQIQPIPLHQGFWLWCLSLVFFKMIYDMSLLDPIGILANLQFVPGIS